MDESSFDIDQAALAESALKFPARRSAARAARPSADVSYLHAAAGADYGRHAWDECGCL